MLNQRTNIKEMTDAELIAYVEALRSDPVREAKRKAGLAEILQEREQEAKEAFIQELAKTGAQFSRYMRDPITGERTASRVSMRTFAGNRRNIYLIQALPGRPLLAIEDIADLYQIAPGRADQYSWDEQRWAEEIRRKLK